MTTLKDLKPGDAVIIRDVNRKEPRAAVVAKVGRKFLELEGCRMKHDLATGKANDGYGHGIVYTMEQWEAVKRAHSAVKTLKGWGVELSRAFKGDPVAACEALRHLFEKGES